MNTNQIIDAMCTMSREDWNKFASNLSDTDKQNAEDKASSLSVAFAEISEYLGYRGAYGMGDHGHLDALKACDKKRKRVRKAIGYSYP